jgi:membrane protein implicated in regulation of membrane protease activity
MHRNSTNRGLICCLAATVLLPVALAVALGLGALLAALGDAWGAAACQRLALVAGGLWAVAVVATTVLNTVATLDDRGRRRPRRRRGHRTPVNLHPGAPPHVADDLRDRPA